MCQQKIHIGFKSGNIIGHITLRVQYIYIVNRNTRYRVAQQESQGNALLR